LFVNVGTDPCTASISAGESEKYSPGLDAKSQPSNPLQSEQTGVVDNLGDG